MPAGEQAVAGEGRLLSSAGALCEAYDAAMLDLDGVVYVGDHLVAGARTHLRRARSAGMRLAYVTNNANRPPEAVAAALTRMGLDAEAADVVTSAQAVVRLVGDQLPTGSKVLVVGGPGLTDALRDHGLTPVFRADDDPLAVVQGFSPDLSWYDLCEAAVAVRHGAAWFAANTDLTIPTARGVAPGNGTFVNAVRAATGAHPVVAGKPEPALFAETVRRLGARRPLFVGDRLDTDIAGAVRFGVDSVLVLTGVADLTALVHASPDQRPSYVGNDLSSLLTSHPALAVRDRTVSCGGWVATIEADGSVDLHEADGSLDVCGADSRTVALRAVVAAAWMHHDSGGVRVQTNGVAAQLSCAK